MPSARLVPNGTEHEDPAILLLEIDFEAGKEKPSLSHGKIVQDQRRYVHGGLQLVADLHQHVRPHGVHGLKELVDEADLVWILHTVAALVVEVVDRRVDDSRARFRLQVVEEALHQQRAHNGHSRPSLARQTVNRDHVLLVKREPEIDDRVQRPHQSQRRRVMIRKASINHSVSEIGRIVFPVTQIDDQIVIAVARVEKPGNLRITRQYNAQSPTSEMLFLYRLSKCADG